MEALFLEHEGYFGALGTFLQSALGADVDRILSKDRTRGVQDNNDIIINDKSPTSS